MSDRPKILWSADAVARTGFARVTENLIYKLKEKYDIVLLANNWWGDTCEMQKDFKMYPSSNRFQTEPYGVQRIREITEKEKPDLIFVNNDVYIVNQLYDQIKDLHKEGRFKFVAYVPMDSYEWTDALATANEWDNLILYTEFGAQEFFRAGYQKAITVIPHGVTEGQFYPMDKKECRKKLGLNADDFIVLNANRNQARKRIDITIEAFSKFAVGKEDVKLYLHMGRKDQGWDVMSLFGQEMRKQGLDPNNKIIMTTDTAGPPAVELSMLRTIYNACDVGVNTCKGEGHGLVNHEHASCRRAQIVPDHTSCKEIFEGACPLIRTQFVDVDPNLNRRMPCPSADHLAELLTMLYEDREMLDKIANTCYERATDEMYQWDTIVEQFSEAFAETLDQGE